MIYKNCTIKIYELYFIEKRMKTNVIYNIFRLTKADLFCIILKVF